MNDPLAILPPKLRASLYALLILAAAVLPPLQNAGIIPAVVTEVTLAALGVFGGAVALGNVRNGITYDARHDDED